MLRNEISAKSYTSLYSAQRSDNYFLCTISPRKNSCGLCLEGREADNPKKKDVYRKDEMKDLRYPIIINVFSFFNEMGNACICLYTHSFGKDSIQTVDQKCPKGLFCFLKGELI